MALTSEKAELISGDLQRELAWARLKIQSLEEQLRLEIEKLGPRSETLSDLQLELLADEKPGATRDEVFLRVSAGIPGASSCLRICRA